MLLKHTVELHLEQNQFLSQVICKKRVQIEVVFVVASHSVERVQFSHQVYKPVHHRQ